MSCGMHTNVQAYPCKHTRTNLIIVWYAHTHTQHTHTHTNVHAHVRTHTHLLLLFCIPYSLRILGRIRWSVGCPGFGRCMRKLHASWTSSSQSGISTRPPFSKSTHLNFVLPGVLLFPATPTSQYLLRVWWSGLRKWPNYGRVALLQLVFCHVCVLCVCVCVCVCVHCKDTHTPLSCCPAALKGHATLPQRSN